ncbi:2-C-methyl-D-erythritol 4-phosphate cytidylyltransferase [Arthrobacter mobilis]|uniref:2-C-methyl-D-erythritol 4-phosphate cytidylyltransferase n=1 Tax=Arthrobacter mobilis TaxID=2724944 RepID=A0A7X6K6Y4_9MICC|nr:2-C-methyl-D-erythritol 4-phosphate cytidylyltransferase [Arthrobacter mobilis]NKX56300.1 2-C-methyl-D-erythritol 4-phosphate cytidylyltransferase [Arthrobacter mobilis]
MSSISPFPASAALKLGVIIVAAGSGQRLGYGLPKAQVPLGGRTILEHALHGVVDSGVAERICVAVPAGDTALRRICARFPSPVPLNAVDGGATRSESVRRALAGIGGQPDAILVHDAARALTPPEVFRRVGRALAGGARAVVPAVAVVDTIKTAAPSSPDQQGIAPEKVSGTVDRALLRAVQTPQGFDAAILAEAHRKAAGVEPESVTDDAMLLEAAGEDVFLVQGSALSLKITTQLDLVVAEALLAGRQPKRIMEG